MFKLQATTPLVLLLSLTSSTTALTQAPDGLIVPFTSVLPLCASACGHLFDVQGACTPPNIATTSPTCFCSDARLTPFATGTAGVSSVCGASSCSSTADLTTIENWYNSYCATADGTATTTSSAASSTGTSGSGTSGGSGSSSVVSSGRNGSWLSTHYKWVIMLIVIFVGIVVIWISAFLFRRRYIRKRDKEIELRPPVAWGPHQLQGMTGGYNYGDGVSDANTTRGKAKGRAGAGYTPSPLGPAGDAGGHSKEAVATPTTINEKKEKGGWLRKARS